MILNTDRLNAFYQVAVDKNFSKAASNLCITQSALSQRILKLEQEIKTTLFVRATDGIKLTESGAVLLDYVRELQMREHEALDSLMGKSSANSGIIRIAAFSSVLRSVIMPALQPQIQASPSTHVEFFSRELRELPAMLESGEADFIIHDDPKLSGNLESAHLGFEYIVHIRSKSHTGHIDTSEQHKPLYFLDHDVEDMTTYHFFNIQDQSNIEIQRSFYDDIYGVIDGVKLGFGEAIVSQHLVSGDEDIEIIAYPETVTSPVILYYEKNRYLTPLQVEVIDTLKTNAPSLLV